MPHAPWSFSGVWAKVVAEAQVLAVAQALDMAAAGDEVVAALARGEVDREAEDHQQRAAAGMARAWTWFLRAAERRKVFALMCQKESASEAPKMSPALSRHLGM